MKEMDITCLSPKGLVSAPLSSIDVCRIAGSSLWLEQGSQRDTTTLPARRVHRLLPAAHRATTLRLIQPLLAEMSLRFRFSRVDVGVKVRLYVCLTANTE